MTDYSAFPYNCEDCGHMYRCNHHDTIYALEQIHDTLSAILMILEERT